MNEVGLIYICKNLINNKIYIGQTIQGLEKRKSKHISDTINNYDKTIFHRALKKYGIDNFEWSILEDNIALDELSKKEIFYIKQYNSTNKDIGYNMTEGGERPPKGNFKLNQEQVNEIINLIQNTSMTLTEIAKIYNVSIYAISDINTGKSWTKQDLIYPIRKKEDRKAEKRIRNKSTSCLSFDQVKNMIIDLKNTTLTNSYIAEKYGVNKLVVASVNNGKNLIARQFEQNFPIRKEKIDINNKLAKNIDKIYADLLNPYLTYDHICKKYKISYITLMKINNGEILVKTNATYPLREKTISLECNKKLTLKQVKEIDQILEFTNISFERIGKLYNVTKPCIRSINNGETWGFVHKGSFPIRKKTQK